MSGRSHAPSASPRLLALLAALAFAATALPLPAQMTGSALPGLEPYDEAMAALLRKWDVPGAGLAVAYRDRLLLVRGYGLADRDRARPVEPSSLFRLASLSKTITAVAVLALVEDRAFSLDDKVLPILGELGPRPDRIKDPRVRDITVRHLLQHSAGFDRSRSGDVMFLPGAARAAERQRAALPPDCPTILRDSLERRLDFTPGERFAYSNIGYCILGRVIERASGAAYEAYVRERVLSPAGATRMRLGRTLQPAPGEVTYHDHRDAPIAKAVPGLGVDVASGPYGSFVLEALDANGGWIGAPVDYLRFVLAIEGWRGPRLIRRETAAWMKAAPGLAEGAGDDEEANEQGAWYGLGIRVRETRGGLNLWHTGSLPGTLTIAVRTADGFAWVAAFNGRPSKRYVFRRELDRALWTAKSRVRKWPEGDLFANRR